MASNPLHPLIWSQCIQEQLHAYLKVSGRQARIVIQRIVKQAIVRYRRKPEVVTFNQTFTISLNTISEQYL